MFNPTVDLLVLGPLGTGATSPQESRRMPTELIRKPFNREVGRNPKSKLHLRGHQHKLATRNREKKLKKKKKKMKVARRFVEMSFCMFQGDSWTII